MSRWLVFFLAVIFISCTGEKEETKKNPTPFPYVFDYSKLEGIYDGNFGGSNITIVLKHVSGKHATGYNLHKGLRRNISGKMSFSDSGFQFSLNEPGNHKYDGIFQFVIDTVNYTLSGTWNPLNNDSLHQKTFVLSKKELGAEYQVFSDSAATLYFEGDGLCRYEFYPVVNQVTRI